MPNVSQQPKPEWSVLTRPGCENVEFRVLLNTEGLVVANLRFAAYANIDKHSAPYDIDVICIQGAGYTQVGDTTAELRAGETIRWPAGIDHHLWTDGETMETLMVERLAMEATIQS